jgi:hypothetical protein
LDQIARRRRFEDDEGWDDDLYERKYYPRKVFKDGRGPRVPLMLSDSAPSLARRQPLMDARMQAHLRVLDGYRRIGSRFVRQHGPHEVRVTDASVMEARSEAERSRDRWIASLRDAYRPPQGGIVGPGAPSDYDWSDVDKARLRQPALNTGPLAGDDPDPDDDRDDDDGMTDAERAYQERNAYLENAYKVGAPGAYRGFDPYALSMWSSQNAISSGSPDAAAANEAYMRRLSAYDPRATAASVTAQNRRYQPGARDAHPMSDSEARADRDHAYGEMLHRLETAWRT